MDSFTIYQSPGNILLLSLLKIGSISTSYSLLSVIILSYKMEEISASPGFNPSSVCKLTIVPPVVRINMRFIPVPPKIRTKLYYNVRVNIPNYD